MKGAADGGLFVPHSDDRLAGSKTGTSKSKKRAVEEEPAAAAGKGKGKGGAPPSRAPSPAPKPAPKAVAAPAKGAGKAAAAGEAAGAEPGTLLYYILGGHVADYMRLLQADTERPGAYERQFSQYIQAGITPDSIQGLYLEAHRKIRANPYREPAAAKGSRKSTRPKTPSLSDKVRRERLNAKLVAAGLDPLD
jgi:hypothetical protein